MTTAERRSLVWGRRALRLLTARRIRAEYRAGVRWTVLDGSITERNVYEAVSQGRAQRLMSGTIRDLPDDEVFNAIDALSWDEREAAYNAKISEARG